MGSNIMYTIFAQLNSQFPPLYILFSAPHNRKIFFEKCPKSFTVPPFASRAKSEQFNNMECNKECFTR